MVLTVTGPVTSNGMNGGGIGATIGTSTENGNGFINTAVGDPASAIGIGAAVETHEEYGETTGGSLPAGYEVLHAEMDGTCLAAALAVAGLAAAAVAGRRQMRDGISRLFGSGATSNTSPSSRAGDRALPGVATLFRAKADPKKPATLSPETLLEVLVGRPDLVRIDAKTSNTTSTWRDEAWQVIQGVTAQPLRANLENAFFSAMIVQGNDQIGSLDPSYTMALVPNPLELHSNVHSYKEADPTARLPAWRERHDASPPVFGLSHVVGMLKSGGNKYLTPERLEDILEHMSLHGLNDDYRERTAQMVKLALYAAIGDGTIRDLDQARNKYEALTKVAVDVWTERQDWDAIRARVFPNKP